MTAIDAVRARLQRDLSLRLIHRDTAGDVQALLDHHAELHRHGEEYRQKISDLYREKYSREDELASVQAHISALPVLIDAVRRLPDAELVLAQWDKASAVRHG